MNRKAPPPALALLVLLLVHIIGITSGWSVPPSAVPAPASELYRPGAIAIIPQDNRTVFYEGTKLRRHFRPCHSPSPDICSYTHAAFDSAKAEIRIEICVLEDPDILRKSRMVLDGAKPAVNQRVYQAIVQSLCILHGPPLQSGSRRRSCAASQ